ncbi:hypothetical protein V6C03_12810 [Methyloligella sp. 2.7D]|uniref:hypothetical protein n=1 Tax=unclassified Methyloligella TaxID=2625955 RepID=UPI00157DB866|nr:hypothetical protein [Methyloligella sp. GL2]QKP77338.1 hypothetical protein HT051_07650 [Methyloligella sp. GL2]
MSEESSKNTDEAEVVGGGLVTFVKGIVFCVIIAIWFTFGLFVSCVMYLRVSIFDSVASVLYLLGGGRSWNLIDLEKSAYYWRYELTLLYNQVMQASLYPVDMLKFSGVKNLLSLALFVMGFVFSVAFLVYLTSTLFAFLLYFLILAAFFFPLLALGLGIVIQLLAIFLAILLVWIPFFISTISLIVYEQVSKSFGIYDDDVNYSLIDFSFRWPVLFFDYYRFDQKNSPAPDRFDRIISGIKVVVLSATIWSVIFAAVLYVPILILTAIFFGGLVWLEFYSRRAL